MLISKAAYNHNTSGNGREHQTLGRGDAACFQSGPHPQQFRKPPKTPDALDDDSQAWHLRAVMQGGGIFYIKQLLCIQWGIVVLKQCIGNIGYFTFNCAAVIFSFQFGTEYAPMNSKCTQSISNFC